MDRRKKKCSTEITQSNQVFRRCVCQFCNSAATYLFLSNCAIARKVASIEWWAILPICRARHVSKFNKKCPKKIHINWVIDWPTQHVVARSPKLCLCAWASVVRIKMQESCALKFSLLAPQLITQRTMKISFNGFFEPKLEYGTCVCACVRQAHLNTFVNVQSKSAPCHHHGRFLFASIEARNDHFTCPVADFCFTSAAKLTVTSFAIPFVCGQTKMIHHSSCVWRFDQFEKLHIMHASCVVLDLRWLVKWLIGSWFVSSNRKQNRQTNDYSNVSVNRSLKVCVSMSGTCRSTASASLLAPSATRCSHAYICKIMSRTFVSSAFHAKRNTCVHHVRALARAHTRSMPNTN